MSLSTIGSSLSCSSSPSPVSMISGSTLAARSCSPSAAPPPSTGRRWLMCRGRCRSIRRSARLLRGAEAQDEAWLIINLIIYQLTIIRNVHGQTRLADHLSSEHVLQVQDVPGPGESCWYSGDWCWPENSEMWTSRVHGSAHCYTGHTGLDHTNR